MIRLPPRSTRTDTLFPYTTLFRSRQCFFELIRGKTGNLNDWASLRRSTRSRLFKELSLPVAAIGRMQPTGPGFRQSLGFARSEEHTSELQSLMRISYAVFCLKKKKNNRHIKTAYHHKYNTRTR